MSQFLPGLPKPEVRLIPIETPPEVSTRIGVDLGAAGIPGGFIGGEYRPLRKPVYLKRIGGRGLVAIATSGLFGRIAVDVAQGHLVQLSTRSARLGLLEPAFHCSGDPAEARGTGADRWLPGEPSRHHSSTAVAEGRHTERFWLLIRNALGSRSLTVRE
ncbi:hypothetical protein [Streptomyces atroolivaceus]|uniref:hypothetical protein n=1 Tax=Streptomyces atroolivaceus TaxID=66869 RepID=UPI00379B8289